MDVAGFLSHRLPNEAMLSVVCEIDRYRNKPNQSGQQPVATTRPATAHKDKSSPSEIQQEKNEKNRPNTECPYERFPCYDMQSMLMLLGNSPTVRGQNNIDVCT